MPQLGHDLATINYQDRERLLSRCNQVRVSISTSVFEVNMLIDVITIATSLYVT